MPSDEAKIDPRWVHPNKSCSNGAKVTHAGVRLGHVGADLVLAPACTVRRGKANSKQLSSFFSCTPRNVFTAQVVGGKVRTRDLACSSEGKCTLFRAWGGSQPSVGPATLPRGRGQTHAARRSHSERPHCGEANRQSFAGEIDATRTGSAVVAAGGQRGSE